MTSTSCITGTGFMKCIPRKRPGDGTPAAISVIEIDEVFEASMVCSEQISPNSREDRELQFPAFGNRFDHHLGRICRLELRCRSDPVQGLARLGSLESVLRNLSRQVLLDLRSRSGERIGGLVDQRDLDAGQREYVRDSVAHRSGADDGGGSNLIRIHVNLIPGSG